MKLLRETVRRLILNEVLKLRGFSQSEPAKEVKSSPCLQANNKIYQAIEELRYHKLKISWTKSASRMDIFILPEDGMTMEIAWLEAEGSPAYDCHDTFIIAQTEVNPPYRGSSGFGALLYDVALELAAHEGLAPDRFSVSSDAVRVWNYFYRSDDYDKKPFDNEEGEFTPGEATDDCEAESYLKHGGEIGDDQEYFQSHPLNNVYYKKDQSQPTISCLREMGLIDE